MDAATQPKRGAVREDGKVFYGMQKNRSGQYYQVWRDRWYAVEMLERRLRRKDMKKDYDAEYRIKNGDAVRATKRRHYLSTRERDRPLWNQRAALARLRNPDYFRSYVAQRRALRKAATPPDANRKMIRDIYKMANRVSECLGIKFHVDHVKALANGGLHHESNLQVLPGRANIIKSDSENFVFTPL